VGLKARFTCSGLYYSVTVFSGLSAVRSIRISRETNGALESEAERRKVTFNQLVSSILTKYCEWDRFAEKLGYVGNSAALYRQLISLIPEDKVEEVGVDSGRMIKEALLLWYKKADTHSLLLWLSNVCKYVWGPFVQYDQREVGENYVLTLHHTFGRKWSTAQAHGLRESFKDVTGLEPKIVTTDNMIAITLPISPKT